jgi:hypothetical protein
MGALLSSLFALLWRSNRKHKVVIVGLDNAGKTTALYKLQLGAQRKKRNAGAYSLSPRAVQARLCAPRRRWAPTWKS